MSKFLDLTTCNLCFEHSEGPMCLPCLHTFCQKCMQSYIDRISTETDSKSVGVNCPICQKFTTLQSDMNPFEWASYQADDLKVSTTMELREIKCLTSHKTEILDRKAVTVHGGHKQKATVTTRLCIKHAGKTLEYFCGDHSEAICGLCLLKEHRKCDKVDTIETLVNEKRETEKDIADKLWSTRIALEQIRQEEEERDTAYHRNLEKIRQEVRTFRNEIKQHLSTLEDNFLEEVGQILFESIYGAREDATRSERLMSQISVNEAILENELPDFHDVEYVERIEILLQSTNNLLDSVKDYESSQSSWVPVFTMDDWVSKFLTECESFGKVTIEVSKNKSKDDVKSTNQEHRKTKERVNEKVIFIEFTSMLQDFKL